MSGVKPAGNNKRKSLIRILDRMVFIDLSKTTISVLSVVVVIIVSRKFIKILEKAIEGAISNETLLNILGLKMISVAIAFLPVAIFMSILMVIGRLYRDQEMSAIFSAGGGISTIYRSIFIFVMPFTLITFALAFYTGPWSEAATERLMHQDEKMADLRGIAAGRFSEYQHGDLVFYVENIDKKKNMRQIFIQHREANNLSIITADTGYFKTLKDGLYIVLENGHKVQGLFSKDKYRIEDFAEYGVQLEEKDTALSIDKEAVESKILWNSRGVQDIAELQRRLSIPAGVFFLSLLAVPLAKTSPRAGVYGNMLTAFLIYFIYGNLVRVNHSWMLKGHISVWYGSLWLYLILFAASSYFFIKFYGWRFISQKIQDAFSK